MGPRGEMPRNWMEMVAAQPCQCRNCHFKTVNFMSCEFHLKASFKKTIRLEGYRDD